MDRLRARSRVALAVLALVAPGCGWILGLDEFTDQPPPAGSGGQGGGGGACEPGATVTCYAGPEGTDGVGVCKAGTAVCGEDGIPEACAGQVTPGTETCVDPADEDCDGQDCVMWGRLFGDISNQGVTDVAADQQGNIYIAGNFNGTLAFSPGQSLTADAKKNIYVAKLDPKGAILWSKGFNSSQLDVSGLATDDRGNVIITGTFMGTLSLGGSTHETQLGTRAAYVLKLTTDGIYSWSEMHENQEEATYVTRPAIDSSGAVIILGDSFCGQACGFPSERIWLRRYGQDGTLAWFKNFPYSGSTGERRAGGVVVDSNDAIFVTGEIGGPFGDATTNFGGPTITCSSDADVFVVKLDPTGGFVWQRFLNGPGDQTVAGIARDSMDQLVVLGTYDGSIQLSSNSITSAGGTDMFVVKYSITGIPMWSRSFGSAGGDERARRLVVDRDNAIVLTGESVGDIDYGGGVLAGYGGIDIPLIKLAPDGAHGWSKLFGSALDQTAKSVCATADGATILAGDVQGSVDLGSGAMFSNGGTDILLAKFGR